MNFFLKKIPRTLGLAILPMCAFFLNPANAQTTGTTSTASGIVDVSSQVSFVSSGIVYNRTTLTFNGVIKTSNLSNLPISGPLQLVLSNLPSGVTLQNATGYDNGKPYITLSGIAPSSSLSSQLVFNNPAKVSFTYTPSLYSGNFLSQLRAAGTSWVNAKNEPVTLKGTNLGNWFLQEFWMMGLSSSGGATDQCTLESKLTERFGYSEKERLIKLYRDNWISSRDFDQMAKFGFNLIRLPILWNVIEDEKNPKTLRADAWTYLDWAIAEGKKRGMYVILDLHGAAGYQSEKDHSGCAGQNKYWTSTEYQDRTKWLWEQIATRYKNESTVAAYDLLNEPWGSTAADMATRITELYHTVRAIDTTHIILLPSYQTGDTSVYGTPSAKGMTNVALEHHPYPGQYGNRPNDSFYEIHRDWLNCLNPSNSSTCTWIDKVKAIDVPLLFGEFQAWKTQGIELGGEVGAATYNKYASLGIAATSWSFKIVTAAGGQGSGTWGFVTNKDPLPAISTMNFATATLADIEALFQSYGTMEYDVHAGLWKYMTQEAPDIFTPPYPSTPTGLNAVVNTGSVSLTWNANNDASVTGYKIYRGNSASTKVLIAEVDYTNTTYIDFTAGTGTKYYAITAKDADDESTRSADVILKTPITIPGKVEAEAYTTQVGITTETTSDIGGGMNVGNLFNGDYMEWDIQNAAAGTFTIDYRVARYSASTSTGKFDVYIDGVKVDAIEIAPTGGWQIWKTVADTTEIPMTAGNHKFKLISTGNGVNMNYFEFKLK